MPLVTGAKHVCAYPIVSEPPDCCLYLCTGQQFRVPTLFGVLPRFGEALGDSLDLPVAFNVHLSSNSVTWEGVTEMNFSPNLN